MLRLFLSFFGIGRYCDLLDAWERQLPPKKGIKNSMKAILEKNFAISSFGLAISRT